MPLLYYTTEYKPERAQAEIQRLLLSIGARRISMEYDRVTRAVTGMSFSLESAVGEREYVLPVRTERVKATLKRQGVLKVSRPEQHAASVAWRTLLEWLKVQLAIIETQQAAPDEVMLPYLMVPDESGTGARSLYEQFADNRALGEGHR
jgi:hypothetical protein